MTDALAESLGVNIELVDAGSYKFTADGRSFTLGSLASTTGADFILGTDANDTINAGSGNDEVRGGSGDDYLHGGSQSDTLLGGDGNDTLIGDNITNSYTGYNNDNAMDARYNKGNDVLAGGAGEDFLAGGYGSDTYIFNKGDGVDTIQEMQIGDYSQKYYDSGSRDTIKFGEGLNQEDVRFDYDGLDLHVTFANNDTDKVIVKNFKNSTLETMQFSDGSVLKQSDIPTMIYGTEASEEIWGSENIADIVQAGAGDDTTFTGSGDDIVYGGDGNDDINAYNSGNNTMYGEAGDDAIGTGAGQDIIDGGIGNDYVESGAGSDTITGGIGDDTLRGESGADTYRYSQGDGNDIIQQASSDGTSTDTLELTDIDHDDILFSRDGDDLNINFDNNILGSVIVDDYFTEQFNNSDGLIIDANDEFALDLSANSNKIAELLAAAGADDIDMDGGSVDGTVQTTTKLSSSELADLWLPKQSNEF
ncbi:calcium-binding protein [Francisella sp. XLW-1]|uniref:calcium-binding protein n=1 Tax=Francisella sp. XLW-1 TaxID=2610887 RepID=UPI00123E2BF1|nr:calcium-binding protein [Francisella sp. XLW-1]